MALPINPFILILVILPLVTFLVSFTLHLLLKKKIVIISGVFLIYLVLTFTVFNLSFLIWSFVYTGIAIIATFLADFVFYLVKRK